MPSSEQRMIDAQAQKITALNKNISDLLKKNYSLEMKCSNMEPAYRYYNLITETVMKDDDLRDMWSDLIIAIKIKSATDIPGLTSEG